MSGGSHMTSSRLVSSLIRVIMYSKNIAMFAIPPVSWRLLRSMDTPLHCRPPVRRGPNSLSLCEVYLVTTVETPTIGWCVAGSCHTGDDVTFHDNDWSSSEVRSKVWRAGKEVAHCPTCDDKAPDATKYSFLSMFYGCMKSVKAYTYCMQVHGWHYQGRRHSKPVTWYLFPVWRSVQPVDQICLT